VFLDLFSVSSPPGSNGTRTTFSLRPRARATSAFFFFSALAPSTTLVFFLRAPTSYRVPLPERNVSDMCGSPPPSLEIFPFFFAPSSKVPVFTVFRGRRTTMTTNRPHNGCALYSRARSQDRSFANRVIELPPALHGGCPWKFPLNLSLLHPLSRRSPGDRRMSEVVMPFISDFLLPL